LDAPPADPLPEAMIRVPGQFNGLSSTSLGSNPVRASGMGKDGSN
jgi:hypothetical protein